MDISSVANQTLQPATLQRSDPNNLTAQQQTTENQQQTQSIDPITTVQPVQQSTEVSKEMVNARVSEHQVLSSTHQITADEAVGSLIDTQV